MAKKIITSVSCSHAKKACWDGFRAAPAAPYTGVRFLYQMNKITTILIISIVLKACAVGNAPFAKRMDSRVGSKPSILDPSRFGDAGDLIRADYLVSGEGFTHTSINKDGDTIQHWFYSEVLPSYRGEKEFIGKCKVFLVVDKSTGLIKSWGYDDGGNPQSCRDWP